MTERNKWDIMLSMFTNKKDFLKREILVYQHEIVTIYQLYGTAAVRQLFVRWLDSLVPGDKQRDEQQSKAFREMGNKLYKSKPPKLKTAIEFYTKAIYLAPAASLELSLAHANRAVALMAINLFQSAYDDCEMAVQYSYPKENILKVLFRQAGCSLKLNNRTMLQKSLKLIENELKNHKSRNVYMKILTEYKSKMQNMKRNNNKSKSESEESDKNIHIECSEEKGRYVISTGALEKDDFIISDTAFAFVPVYEQYPDENSMDADCQQCAKTNVVQFPCENCHRATYCSIQCRLDHEPIHSIECPGYRMNLWYYIGIAHLSLRTFITGFPEMVDRVKNERDMTVKSLWKKVMDLAKTDPTFKYGKVLGLVRNFKNMKDTKDFLRYSVTATMLVVYLQDRTRFFEHMPAVCKKIMPNQLNWELFADSLIMLHMGQLVSNGHAITDLRTTSLSTELECMEAPPPNTIKPGKLHCYVRSVRVFTALFPKISLLNHSCDANITNRFHRNKLMIYASRPIAAQEEIFNCYGPNYRLMSTEDRRQALSDQYCFHCKCEKCEQEPEDRSYHQYLICEGCQNNVYLEEENFWWRDLQTMPKILCNKCGQRITFSWYSEFLVLLGRLESAEAAQVEEVFGNACNIYESLCKVMSFRNEMRLDVGAMILCHFIPFLHEYKSFMDQLLRIAISLLEARQITFGPTVEFIIASTYMLDLMAIHHQMSDELCPAMVIHLYYIRQSLLTLSAETREILESYIEQYIP